ncbi:hypothetical protein INT43_004274 [Umbelopsis isabellina]|uniref:Uncharacterized protein n=1 Tax=Mortierella isabellina TaxID=91625 RepID=A0A8H7PI37_MORIS|nr:hypothetical protein INT43_004274 [Umbelopsis isabellina]
MDSQFTHIHWATSRLAILSDEWIGERLPEETVEVPKEHQLAPDEDGDICKQYWAPDSGNAYFQQQKEAEKAYVGS